jgi:hypothetical protein
MVRGGSVALEKREPDSPWVKPGHDAENESPPTHLHDRALPLRSPIFA